MTPEELSKVHPLLAEAVAAALEACVRLDADGEAIGSEDYMAKCFDYAGDRFVAWVGKMTGHPWYTRGS